MKYWKSVLRRSKQIHFGRLSIELLMSGIIYFMIILAMWAIRPEVRGICVALHVASNVLT